MKAEEVTSDMIANMLRIYLQNEKDVDYAKRMSLAATRNHLERLVKDTGSELPELVHKFTHAVLDTTDAKLDLHHVSLCEIVAITFLTTLIMLMDMTKFPTEAPNIPTSKIDYSKVN